MYTLLSTTVYDVHPQSFYVEMIVVVTPEVKNAAAVWGFWDKCLGTIILVFNTSCTFTVGLSANSGLPTIFRLAILLEENTVHRSQFGSSHNALACCWNRLSHISSIKSTTMDVKDVLQFATITRGVTLILQVSQISSFEAGRGCFINLFL